MDLKLWGLFISGVISLVGLFGWSHRSLRDRIMNIEQQLHHKQTEAEVRMLIQDKLAPYKVEYHSLSRRIDEMNDNYKSLSQKMDKVIELCSKLDR